ncbi:hypothetical protein ACOSQ4_021878 [Xanthoceras sorbifolium]
MSCCGEKKKRHVLRVFVGWLQLVVAAAFMCVRINYCGVQSFLQMIYMNLVNERIWLFLKTNYILCFLHLLEKKYIAYTGSQPDHVFAFLLAELGTSGSLDGQQRLVVNYEDGFKWFVPVLAGEFINEKYKSFGFVCILVENPRLGIENFTNSAVKLFS